MVYLTFDSNIWIYLLDDSWREDNALDYLEHWISENHIKILLPEVILAEWDKHKEKEKDVRKKKLRDFFSMAGEILPSSFFEDYKKPDKQSEIIESQFNRIENLIRFNAKQIDISQEVKNKAIERSIQKEAPMHKNKNSIADTLIILSLHEFISSNNENEYIFLSENIEDFFEIESKKSTKPNEIIELWESHRKEMIDHYVFEAALKSFFEKSYKIHTDLKKDFSEFNLREFRNLKTLVEYLKKRFPVTVNLDIIRKERIKNKIMEVTYNPELDKLFKDLPKESFIKNINYLETLLKKVVPTQEEAKFAFSLINSDNSYKKYFFENVESIAWFNILKNKGVFNPENNPSPDQVKEGYQIPFWEPLLYLEKISQQIQNGNNIEFIKEIVAIIDNVSKRPVDNYRTWVTFIKIIAHFPNEKIPITTLEFIPKWFESVFDTMSQTSAICEKLLPKFLNRAPTQEDISKAELILKHLLSIEKIEEVNTASSSFKYESYRSRVYLYFLIDSFITRKLGEKIAQHCSDQIVVDLAINLKKLRFDFPKGLNISIKEEDHEYIVQAEIKGSNLYISIANKSYPEITIEAKVIEKFEELSNEQTKNAIKAILKTAKIEYGNNEDNLLSIDTLTNILIDGSYQSLFDNEPISQLNNEYHRSERLVDVFLLIFKELLNEKVKLNTKKSTFLLELFALDNKYRSSFFRRVVLFVIGENWLTTKTLFWTMVNNNNALHLFSNRSLNGDLYELLNKNQLYFDEEDKKTLQKIINQGPYDKQFKDKDYWSVRWYAALRNIDPFKSRYEELSVSQNLTYNNFESQSLIKWGSASPLSVNEILKQSNEEIANFIHAFKPKTSWEDPSIDGFSNAFNKAVENDPQKFSSEIELYKEVYYIYAYQLAQGFKEAWKNHKGFNWEKVLNFFKVYISSEKFRSGKLVLENDGWGATADWVTGAISDLLVEGMKSDNNAFDLSLLPLAKNIVTNLVSRLKIVEDYNQTNMDYPTYSLNSTAGKAIRALLDYSLRRARTLKPEEEYLWEADIKFLLEVSLSKGIIDGYVLLGWHFQLFYLLDKDWITNKVREFYQLNDKEWLAFLSGLTFGNPSFNKEIYLLFYPHYERAINKDVQFKRSFDHGIVRHLVAFFFWEFEDMETEGLLSMFLQKKNHENILELVNFVWRQESYLKSLKPDEVKNFEIIILNLWSFLATEYEIATAEEEQKVLISLSNLLIFAPVLNSAYTKLVLKSTKVIRDHFHIYYLIENLIRLKDHGSPSETAKHIGVILIDIRFDAYVYPADDEKTLNLVIFLYKNGQKTVADEFCNRMTKLGFEGFIEIYNKYNR